MKLEQKIEELKDRVDLMSQCYLKGFGNKLVSIAGYANFYVDFPEKRDETKLYMLEALETLEKVEESYKSVPFDRLDSNSDFAPLFIVKDLLPQFSEKIRKVVDEPSEGIMDEICELQKVMWYVGEMYRENLKKRLNELKQLPGCEDFKFTVTDYEGNSWSNQEAGLR